jgi:hypothetical protein
MSHGMLHHIEPKYSLNCCTYLIWFEFETWFEFEFKTLEKINSKGNRNYRKKEKANSAQTSPLSLACARAPSVPDRQASPVGANPSVFTPSLSLVAPWGRAVGTTLSPSAPTLSLCPTVPTCQLSPTSRPWSPRRGRPCSRVLRPCPRARAPFEPRALLAHLPLFICALCQTPSPSLSLCPREQRAPPPPVVDCCRSAVTVASAPHSVSRWVLPRCQLLGTPFGVPFL